MTGKFSVRALWACLGLLLLALVPPGAAAANAPYLLGVVTRFLIYGLAAVSLDLVIGYGAMVSFGHAMFFGLGGYVVGIIAFHFTEAGPILGWAGSNAALVVWPIALAVCALAGLLFGYLALRTRAPASVEADMGTTDTDAEAPLPAPAAGAVTGLADPLTDPLAEGPSVAAFVANADQQLRTGALLAPKNANAWDSIEAAWRTNPTHPDTLRLTALLFDALANASERALLDGDLATARLAFERARQLDVRRGGTGASIVLLRKRLDAALEKRLTGLLAKPATRPAAAALLADTNDWLGLDPARQRALQARVGKPASGTASRTASTASAAPAATEIVTITRADYARFASASGRTAAECGRGFFGRKLRWDNTGGDRRPVVCVSAADALAFAAWLGKQDGHRYRLPSAGELREPASRRIGGWLTLCADRSCATRMVAGKSAPLDASRGYDDVGIQLVRAG